MMKIVPLTPMRTPEWEGTVTLLLHGESVDHDLLRVPRGLSECSILGATWGLCCIFWQSRWGRVRAVCTVSLSGSWEGWPGSQGDGEVLLGLEVFLRFWPGTRLRKQIWKSGWDKMTYLCAAYLAWKNQGETALKKLKGLAVSCLVMEVLELCFCFWTDSSNAAESTAIDCYW